LTFRSVSWVLTTIPKTQTESERLFIVSGIPFYISYEVEPLMEEQVFDWDDIRKEWFRMRVTPPNTSLEPTADAAAIHMRMDSSITVGLSSPRLTELWLSLIR